MSKIVVFVVSFLEHWLHANTSYDTLKCYFLHLGFKKPENSTFVTKNSFFVKVFHKNYK